MTRRNWLAVFPLASSLSLAADPWKRRYAQWSKDDALAILNRSPWAQAGKVEFKYQGKEVEGPRSGGVVGPPEGPPGGNGTVGPPGGAPARAGGGIVQNGPGVMPEFRALVRWESARPMRLALGAEPGAISDSHQYVISVLGFPILRADVAASLGALKGSSRLERAGKDWLRPVRVESRESSGATALVFKFDGDALPVTAEDKEVLFVARLGTINLRVKFTLKDMMYEKQLAL